MKGHFKTVIFSLLLVSFRSAGIELESPDGKVVAQFDLKTVNGEQGCLVYSVRFQNRVVLTDSRLGLKLLDGPLDCNFQILDKNATGGDSTWKPVCGERATIRDNYRQLIMDLQQTSPPRRRLQITFRAYNEGVAFHYSLPAQAGLTNFVIQREGTQFVFTGDHTAWAVYNAQGNYDPNDRRGGPGKRGPVPLSQLRPGVERPLTVRVAEDLYASVTEAGLVDYARMKLRRATNSPHTLEAFLDAERGVTGEVTGSAPFASPWRVVMVADSPGKLLEQNYLVLNLNEPCALIEGDSRNNLNDCRREGMCGFLPCERACNSSNMMRAGTVTNYDPKSDARQVHLDPKRNPNPDSLNLQEVIDYANSKGIGIILYVNHLAMEKQLDEILPLYEQWGVKGVKYGFVNVGSQHWTAWLHEAIRKAAAHHLMVDIHDEFRNTGYQRTYPNLMTTEGVGGNEEFPTPVHNATLPFTRFLTGPADYTYCWNDARLKVTKAHQLALSTIFFSPWQFLFWYATPASVTEEPALDYWKNLPTTWDETRVIQGEIGRRAVVARRKGNDWFVGAISSVDGKLQIPLDFLEPGTKFKARIYSDPSSLSTGTASVQIDEQPVDLNSTLTANLPVNGGEAIRLVPLSH
jgi:alpha-glucosidase